jgi:hypothetical protein
VSLKFSAYIVLALLCGGATVVFSTPRNDGDQEEHNLKSPPIGTNLGQPSGFATPSRLPLETTPSAKPLVSKAESQLFVASFDSLMSSPPDTVAGKLELERADFLTNQIVRIKEINSDFDSYPFLDPQEILREFGGFVGSQMLNVIQSELSVLIQQTEILDRSWWGPNKEAIPISFSSDAYVASLPPTWVIASPLFGDVDLDTVLSQQNLLRDIRREYLFNYVMSSRKATFYKARIENPNMSFSPAIQNSVAANGDARFLDSANLSSTFKHELKTIEQEMAELRHQYLLALGNAVYAMELPSFTD